jgi:integrase
MTAKRGNNEGSIYQRADRRWVAALSVGDVGGKPRRKVVYGKTRAEVARQLTRLLGQQEHDLRPTPARLTVAAWFDDWLNTTVARNPRGSTRESYTQAVSGHIVPKLGRITLAKLEPKHVEAWLADLLANGLAPATVRRLHAILHIGLEQALRQGYIVRNVAGLVSRPKVDRTPVQPLDQSEARQLLDFLRTSGHRDAAQVAVLLTTGLRQGELFGLTWPDVDLERGTLQVHRQFARGEFGPLKRDTAVRTLRLRPWVQELLRQHRVQLKTDRLLAGARWQEHELVFPNTMGRPQTRGNAHREWKRLLRAAGLRDARFHDLRHTAATLALSQGAALWDVSQMLGHASITTTGDVYSHWTDKGREDVASRLEQALTG